MSTDDASPGHLQDRLATLADDVIALAEPPERCGGVAALRAPQARDADAIVAAGNDDDIRRWTELPIPYRRADALDFIERMSVSGRVDGSMVPFVAVDTHDEVLGCLSVHNIDASGAGAVGYWIAPWARGKGAGAWALRALVGWGFDSLGLRALVWQAMVGNVTSLAVATDAGFRPEGTLRSAMRHRAEMVDCWAATLLPGEPREPDPIRVAARSCEIAAGAWQVQPADTSTARNAEHVLPCSGAQAAGLWAVRHSTTAELTAVVALLAAANRAWVISAPVPSGGADDEAERTSAAATGASAVRGYARGALGLDVDPAGP